MKKRPDAKWRNQTGLQLLLFIPFLPFICRVAQTVAFCQPVHVPRVFSTSLNGKDVEEVPDGKGGAFLVRVYEKAPGRKVEEKPFHFSENIFRCSSDRMRNF
jgi:hypothetical protein